MPKITKKEKEKIIESLIEMGCTQPYDVFPSKLKYKGYEFEVKDYDTLSSVFEKILKIGKTLKVWEIKGVLEIV